MSFLTPQPTLTYSGLKLPLKHHHHENSTNLQGPLPTGLPMVLTLTLPHFPALLLKSSPFCRFFYCGTWKLCIALSSLWALGFLLFKEGRKAELQLASNTQSYCFNLLSSGIASDHNTPRETVFNHVLHAYLLACRRPSGLAALCEENSTENSFYYAH